MFVRIAMVMLVDEIFEIGRGVWAVRRGIMLKLADFDNNFVTK